jgi:release factor glutamine methyltransferase
LIPRPETEEWVSVLIEAKRHDMLCHPSHAPNAILDMCTGSGCIALAWAKYFPDARVIGIDVSEKAITLAQKNKRSSLCENVEFVESDLFSCVQAQLFDIIVANPPYISCGEWEALDPAVRLWEDKCALCATDNGLSLIKKIVSESRGFLAPGGQLALEIDRLQGDAVCTFMNDCGYTHVHIQKDFAGLDRVVIGVKGSDGSVG